MRALFLLLLLAPVAIAYPTSTTYGDYEGVATQGSRDFSQDWPWWGGGLFCTQSLEDFLITLYVDEAADDDILLLEAPVGLPRAGGPGHHGYLPATVDSPAVFYSAQSDGCEEFWVHGHSVASEARYHVTVETCLVYAVVACV